MLGWLKQKTLEWRLARARKAHRRDLRKAVNAISKFMKANWVDAEPFDGPIYLKWPEVRRWLLGEGATLKLERFIRGDIVTLTSDGEEIAAWVDQSHQYNGMLGQNDFAFKACFSHEYVTKLLERYVRSTSPQLL